jgi:hypothetical protein
VEVATPTPGDDRHRRVTELSRRARNAFALRTALAADPSLVPAIEAYFADGNEDAGLNDLMGMTFAGQQSPGMSMAPVEDPGMCYAPEKDPTDPTQALPASRTGDKALSKGQMKWTLNAVNHNSAKVDVAFTPDKDKVQASTVSFVQTVLNKVGDDLAYAGGTAANPALNKGKFERFEEATSKKRIDHLPDSENDPFYGAEWDQANKKWKRENGT